MEEVTRIGLQQAGASLLSYAALVALIAVVAMAGVAWMGQINADKACQAAFGFVTMHGAEHGTAYFDHDHPLGPQCCIELDDGGFGFSNLCESDL